MNICATASAATLASCLASPATTYTTTNAGVTCPTTAQLTPATGGACTPYADAQGGYGFWGLAGLYSFYLRVPATAGGGTYGPYPINIGSSTGCPSNATCDANYATLALACAAAGSGTLYVSKAWNGTPSISLCSVNFLGNGAISMASSAALTFQSNATLTAPSNQKIFDVSASGSSVTFNVGTVAVAYPEWFGAIGDNNASHDSTKAIQAVIDASCRTGTCLNELVFSGLYYTSAQINGYGATAYNNLRLTATQAGVSGIYYNGPSNTYALRTIGQFTNIGSIKISNSSVSGWKAAWGYDGQSGIGASTGGYAQQLVVECGGNPGDGIITGAGGFQADQLLLDKPYITDCYFGNGVNVADPNSLSNTINGGSIGHAHVAVHNTTNSNNVTVMGTEMDDNDINIWPSLGGVYNYTGVRSEGSRRMEWTAGASAAQAVTISSWLTGAYNDVRPTTTGTGTATQYSITLSCPSYTTGGPCFTEGDYINIAGAGSAGATLNVAITGLSGTNLNVAALSAPIVTSVSGASVTLDTTTAHLIMLWENAAGPYVHTGNNFQQSWISGSTSQVVLASAGNSQSFTNNTWGGYGTLVNGPFASGALPSSSVVFGNIIDNNASFGGPFYPNSVGGMAQQFLPGTLVSSSLTSFTPVLKFCSGAIPATCVAPTGITYVTQTAWYRTTNGQTTAYIYITLSNKGTGPSSGDTAVITGEPASATSGGGGVFLGTPSTFTSTTAPLLAQIQPGASYVSLYQNQGGGFLAFSNFSNSTTLTLTLTYD